MLHRNGQPAETDLAPWSCWLWNLQSDRASAIYARKHNYIDRVRVALSMLFGLWAARRLWNGQIPIHSEICTLWPKCWWMIILRFFFCWNRFYERVTKVTKYFSAEDGWDVLHTMSRSSPVVALRYRRQSFSDQFPKAKLPPIGEPLFTHSSRQFSKR